MSPKTFCDADKMIALMKRGDLEALERMTRCFGDRLVAVGRSRCSTEDQAQDAVQDALLSAGQNLQSFRGDGSIEGWLVRMVANACRRFHRGRKNDPSLHVLDADLGDGGAEPEAAALRLEMADHLGEALLALSARDRAMILLSDAEGWKAPEIAEKMGMSPGSVRTRLSRARKRLRENVDLEALLPAG
jgi:RNA polymerase sigma-70 factor, ECF subfamily